MKHAEGLIIGMAVGDALGLPYEGLSPRRAKKLFPPPLRPRFVLGWAMCSDDTEHACMTAQAILASRGDPERFARSLAWRLRGWLLGVPAGIGLATLKSILRLWIGFPPSSSGVWSAGNGPAMRAPILGVCMGDRPGVLYELVRASTLITHRDPRALNGSLLLAHAAWIAANDPPESGAILQRLRELSSKDDEALQSLLKVLARHLEENSEPGRVAAELGLQRGVTGFIYHTVPVALFAWLKYRNDFRSSIENVISMGGDTDTVAAITGALCGAESGVDGIPKDWLADIAEFPRSIAWMRRLANALAGGQTSPQPVAWWFLPIRNLVFAIIVLLHGFRRLFPPY